MEQMKIAKSVVDDLVADGKITQAEVAKYFPETVDKIGFLADTLHAFLCFEKHTGGFCDYYMEEQLGPEEYKPTKGKWRAEAVKVALKLNLKTLEDVKRFSSHFTNFCKEVYSFTTAFPEGGDLLKDLVDAHRTNQARQESNHPTL